MNRTVDVKVRNIQQKMISVLSCENAPACRKRPCHCQIFVFSLFNSSSNSSNSSSPDAVAHEQ